MEFVLYIFEQLKLSINYKKSMLTPTHALEHLGLNIDSKSYTFSIPKGKALKIRKSLKLLLKINVLLTKSFMHL